ncbi:exodeoxyribonuclease V subunit alpha [Chitinimonas sp.]|uniref:exodeoxyribonuclease V subunit alpha n=1 Tax=Chitinimonas sp. TaxID=1934313 RepID=UPI002F95C3F2
MISVSPLLPPYATELSHWLVQRYPAAAEAALRAAGLVASRLEEGHVCVHLPSEAGQHWQGQAWPALANWRQALLDSGFVSEPGGYTPLVLEGERLYLARLRDDEYQLAASLRERAAPSTLEPARIRKVLAPLFQGQAEDDGQRLAAATALLNRVAVISGGPGTGKTTTVAKILAALLQLEPNCRIRLAAPTGKAAARMVEALAQARQRLDVDLVTLAGLPQEATTLHRLLGYRPDSAKPRYGPDQPLALDVLVVDEASMIDLPLFSRLLQALPAHARLILLGDRDQLASVEAGNAFAELVTLAARSRAGASRLSQATGAKLVADPVATALGDGIAQLTVSHRFHGDSGIGELARRSNHGDAEGSLALLREGRPDLSWEAGRLRDWLPTLLARLGPALQDYRTAVAESDVAAAFASFDKLRLLCALRDGPVGVDSINQLIESRVFRQDPRRQPWYPGRPVIIRSNDAALGLANGDVGLSLAGPEGLRVYFPAERGWRALAPARLPAHDTAFALTVHQSQGSEFDTVWLLLPDEDAAILSRSLIYTAVTRARKAVALWGSGSTLAAAVARETRRESGLVARLKAAEPLP